MITNDKQIAALTATGKRQFFKTPTAVVVRVEPAGNITFIVWQSQKQYVIGKFPATNLEKANVQAVAKLDELIPENAALPNVKKLTINGLAKLFTAKRLSRRKHPEAAAPLMKAITSTMGKLPVKDLSPFAFVAATQSYVDNGHHAQAGRVLGLARQMMSYAAEIHATPLLYKLTLEDHDIEACAPRQRTLEDHEITEFFDAFDAYDKQKKEYSLYLKLLLATGLRSVEIRLLPWANIDYDAMTFTVPKEIIKAKHGSKTVKDFVVPLTDYSAELFRNMHELTGAHSLVLGGMNAKSPAITLGRFITRTEVVDSFVIHDLRRTFRSNLSAYTDTDTAERCLNHTRPLIEGIYDTDDRLELRRAALTTWNDKLKTLIS